MKMVSWSCCVLVYDRSKEPVVHRNESGLPRTDVSGSEFDVGAPTSEEVEKKKNRSKHAPKSLLTAVFESWLLSILHCMFLVISVAHLVSVCSWCRKDSRSFRKWRCIDWCAVEGASHNCYQEPGTVGWEAPALCPWGCQCRGRSLELLEQAFDDGIICVQKRNLLVLFHVDSSFYHICAF